MIFDFCQLTIGAHLNEAGVRVSKGLSALLQFCNTSCHSRSSINSGQTALRAGGNLVRLTPKFAGLGIKIRGIKSKFVAPY
jgi:hypothetical protein